MSAPEIHRLMAFERLVEREWDRLYRYAYRLCGNADDAEDLLSESLLEAYQAFGSFWGDGFDRWVFRILAHNRIDMARRAKIRRAESLESGRIGEDGQICERQIADIGADPAETVVENLFSENLQSALDTLSEEFRAPLLLCDVEQLEYAEIAAALGIPIGTVRSRIHRARQQMRRLMEKS